ncbi:AAA family ATPase, partial [Candidatus Vampirococcus lugosii]
MKKIAIGIQDFKKLITDNYYYIDKTKIIYNLLISNNYYFLSRPRRFGKSLTLSMIKYLYMGEKELFKNTYIYDKRNFEETNPVVYISFASYNKFKDVEKFIKYNLNIYIEDKIYKIEDFVDEIDLGYLVKEIYEKTGKQVVVLIDEYDKVILTHLQDRKKAEYYREFFGAFYSGIKDADQYIKMFFLTGLTKILKMNIFSSLNNLQDISYDPFVYDIMGYTWEDIEKNFEEEIKEIAEQEGKEEKEIKDKIKLYYNGYNFGNSEDTIFNPWNINNLILKRNFQFYWSDTGIPSAIVDYIKEKNIDVVELVERINT